MRLILICNGKPSGPRWRLRPQSSLARETASLQCGGNGRALAHLTASGAAGVRSAFDFSTASTHHASQDIEHPPDRALARAGDWP